MNVRLRRQCRPGLLLESERWKVRALLECIGHMMTYAQRQHVLRFLPAVTNIFYPFFFYSTFKPSICDLIPSVDWSHRSRLRRDARSPKIDKQDRVDIRDRLGYKKILAICQQAKRDGYEWVWVDTCCIDKRSSVELSEAINSMYRWYENSKVYISLKCTHRL